MRSTPPTSNPGLTGTRGHSMPAALVTLCLTVALLSCASEGAEPTVQPIGGIAESDLHGQAFAEAFLLERIQPSLLREISRTLTERPHIAGSEGQLRVRDYVAARFEEWGLDHEFKEYEIYLPWPTEVSLTLLTPPGSGVASSPSLPVPSRGVGGSSSSDWSERRFVLTEETLDVDAVTALEQFPWVNGFSGAGSVEAEVLYANYGLHDDYADLAKAGLSVEGKIVLARYGGSFRGIKARLAEEHGALGLVMFSDPNDDGYVVGDMYPDGPFRPGSGVQRGSVMNGIGDPTTPGWASVPGAERVDPLGEQSGLPRIPVIPVSFDVAREILAGIGGEALPRQSWQGGLPLRYRVGPGPARLRMSVRHDDAYRSIFNVLARIEGTEWPEEWVVIGAHIDAWGAGANDNVSGTASVMVAAEAFARLAADGIRPKRTVIFAGWDAEEWGIIGSTEWVEEFHEQLHRNGVAYINQDGVAGGGSFGASGSPSLKRFLTDAARAVPHSEGGSVEEQWRAQQGLPEGDDVPLGNLGGGSDFAGFYNHIGIPSTGHGFGGPSGVYHSAYDTYHWMTTFGDPDFERHAMSSRITAIMALRLANASVLPYDYVRFGSELGEVVRQMASDEERSAEERKALRELNDAFKRLRAAGETLETHRQSALSRGITPEQSVRANALLREVERAMTREDGLENRPWFRNLIFASDYRNGYATIALPGIAEAIRGGSESAIVSEARDLRGRVDRAVDLVLAASREIRE